MKARFLFLSFVLLVLCSCKKDIPALPDSLSYPLLKFGGSGDDFFHSGVVADEAIFSFGTSNSFNGSKSDYYLVKTNSDGAKIWEKTFGSSGDEDGRKIIKLSDESLLLIGSVRKEGEVQRDLYLIKIDFEGNVNWEKTHGDDNTEMAYSAIELENEEIVLVGSKEGSNPRTRDIFVLWIDQDGNFLREKQFGGDEVDGATDIVAINEKELMIFGHTYSFGAQDRDLFMLKINPVGDSLWSRMIGGIGYEESHSIIKGYSSELLLSAHTSSKEYNHNAYGINMDANGSSIWEQEYGDAQHDGAQDVIQDGFGGYLFLCRSNSFGAGKEDVLLIQTDGQGNELSKLSVGGSENDRADEILYFNERFYIIGYSDSQESALGHNDAMMVIVSKNEFVK